MARALTAKFIENIKPGATRKEIRDGGCRSLYLVIQPTGRTAWALRYSFHGRTRKLTLDPGLSLAEARKAATTALHELERGHDPAALKFDAQAKADKAAADRQRDTIERLAEEFIAYQRRKTRPKSWAQTEHVFRDIVLPAWCGRVVHDVQRRDIRELVEGVAEDRPVMANRALAHLSRFFSWLCERDVIAASPSVGVKPPTKEIARDRALSDDEIVKLWHACDAIGGPAGPAIKLLLLTGQRYGEVVGMRRSEINGDVWTLSADRTKNKHKHEVPLSKQALAIIEAMPVKDGDFVFTSSATRRLANFFRAKALLDAQMNPKEPWVLHDLRRAAATGMQRLGIQLPTIEKCLNHISGSFRGVVRTYQTHAFATEKREALQRWADHVDGLVNDRQTNVITLRRV